MRIVRPLVAGQRRYSCAKDPAWYLAYVYVVQDGTILVSVVGFELCGYGTNVF